MIKFIEFGSNYGHTFLNEDNTIIADGEFTNEVDDTILVTLRGTQEARTFPNVQAALNFLNQR